MNELDQTAGGSWIIDTLTEEESAPWRALLQVCSDAQCTGSWSNVTAAVTKLSDYKVELDVKYGIY